MTSQEITNLWREFHSALKTGDLNAATYIARRGLRLHRERGDYRHAGIWRRALADALFQQGRYDEATKEARKSVATQPDPYEQSLSLIALGQMHSNAGRYRSALSAYNRALKMANSFVGDVYLWSHLYGNRAVTFWRVDRYDEAIIDWEGAVSLLRREGHLRRVAGFLNNIGFLLSQLGRYEDAEQRLLEALELIEADPHSFTEGLIYDSLGYLYASTERHIDAERFLRKSAKIFEQLGDKSQLAGTILHFSELHQRTRHYESAFEEAVRALEMANEVSSEALRRVARERAKLVARARVDENLKDFFAIHRRNCSRLRRIKQSDHRGPTGSS